MTDSLAERLYDAWRREMDRSQPLTDGLGFNRPRWHWRALSAGTQRTWRRIALEASEAMIDEDTRGAHYWKTG